MKLKLPERKKNNSTKVSVKDKLKNVAKRVPEAAGNTSVPSDAAVFALGSDDRDGFTVNVRNEEPILRRLDEEQAGKVWLKDLQINLAGAVILMVLFSLILTSAYIPEMIPFTIPAAVVFMLISTLESLGKERIQLITGAVIGVLLIAALIILRKYIGNGWALIMDQFYDTAEESQAYVYDRFNIGSTGDEHPYRSMHFALLWASALIGLITAMPSARIRRWVEMVVAAFTIIAFAYYGIIPSAVCIAVLAAALVFALARGHILSSLPVLLVVMIVFGAILLVDPGESYGISRADENFRDRFALRSSYLERGDDAVEDIEDLQDQMQNDKNRNNENGGADILAENKWMVVLGVILLILAVLGAIAWVFRQRLRKRQLANRAGIDSSDPRTAIVAMFPYAVRWLQPAGIEPAGKMFGELVPLIRADVSEVYADRYTGMYEMWKEAAYSDHEMDEERRLEMDSFMKDTISMVRRKGNFRTNLINTIKYAL